MPITELLGIVRTSLIDSADNDSQPLDHEAEPIDNSGGLG
jgi:hypothetical protein